MKPGVGGREVLAKVAEDAGTENCVGYRMGEDVTVGGCGKAVSVGNCNAT